MTRYFPSGSGGVGFAAFIAARSSCTDQSSSMALVSQASCSVGVRGATTSWCLYVRISLRKEISTLRASLDAVDVLRGFPLNLEGTVDGAFADPDEVRGHRTCAAGDPSIT